MSEARPEPSVRYTGGRLDREGERRQDPAWVASMRAHAAARVVPLVGERVLVRETDGDLRAARLPMDTFVALAGAAREPVLLGLDDGAPTFALDVAGDAEHAERVALDSAPGARLATLQSVAMLLPMEDAALLAHARGILGWHRRTRFCATCGAATTVEHGGHMRRCVNPDCGAQTFPRTDPAVIVLVERAAAPGRPRACLLARHRRTPATRMFSTLAGFVEPGESLEEAVARELLEEVGVHVTDVRYVASQPWPFPASLMVGFRATATSDELAPDAAEIEEAGWFTAEELATFGESDGDASHRLPGRASIARLLLDGWLAEDAAAR